MIDPSCGHVAKLLGANRMTTTDKLIAHLILAVPVCAILIVLCAIVWIIS